MSVAHATHFQYVHIDRGPLGYMLYDKIYNRESEKTLNRFIDDWNAIKKNSLVIYLTADFDTIQDRIKYHNDEYLSKDLLEKEKEIYDEIIEEYCKDVPLIIVDTSKTSLEDCTKLVTDYIKEIEDKE